MTLTIGSMCSGIDGLEIGVARALGDMGISTRTIWQAEVNEQAAMVLGKRYGVMNLGDIKEVDWDAVERPDIILAGYPCQPFSYAGKRQGRDDPRHLWPAVHAGLLALGPSYVILENVPGHLTKGFGKVLRALAQSGFMGRWDSVRASDVGAPHKRERLFVVAHAKGAERRDQEPNALGAGERAAEPGERAGEAAPDTDDIRLHGGGGAWNGWTESTDGGGLFDFKEYAPAIRRWERILGRPAPSPADWERDKRGELKARLSPRFVEWMMGFDEGWVTDLIPQRTHALRLLGNAVVPQAAQLATTLLWPHKITS